MDTQQQLRIAIAEFLQTRPEDITANLSLSFAMGSIGRARLAASIQRRTGVLCPQVYTAKTYGELELAILKQPQHTSDGPVAGNVPAQAIPVEPSAAIAGDVACGIDIEMVDSLPAQPDYWESDFYRSSFSPTEIAFCNSQENPRLHFAARWAAKEALKKCDAQFMSVDMNLLEVLHNESSKPSLALLAGGEKIPLPFAVSLTHTSLLAAAIVVKVGSKTTSGEARTTTPIIAAHPAPGHLPIPGAETHSKPRLLARLLRKK